MCERFGCLPSQLDREPTRLPGGRPGLLTLLSIEALGGRADGRSATGDDDGYDEEGW